MKTKYLSLILAAIYIAACLPSIANATIANDATAIMHGSQDFNRPSDQKFFARIDYAVYALGNYPGSLTFPADKFVYCYQLFNLTTSTTNINSLTINLDTDLIASYNPYYDTASGSGASGGSIPPIPTVGSDTIYYNFTSRGTAILTNQHSAVLLFTSDFAPVLTIDAGTATDTYGSFTFKLPIPTPEPASVLLLALAAPTLLRIRGRNRKQ
jgi:hypothetical protein